jgi:NTP pyrophosphatase (non-canonical NTP hydrolase)
MTIKKLQKICHKIAIEKGFWGDECPICKGRGDIKRKDNFRIRCYNCSGKGIIIPKNINLPEKLMLIVTELGEACEALRTNNKGKYVKFKNNKLIWKKDTFEDELADAVIRIFDLAESQNINLEWQIQQKLLFNKKRKWKHKKLF